MVVSPANRKQCLLVIATTWRGPNSPLTIEDSCAGRSEGVPSGLHRPHRVLQEQPHRLPVSDAVEDSLERPRSPRVQRAGWGATTPVKLRGPPSIAPPQRPAIQSTYSTLQSPPNGALIVIPLVHGGRFTGNPEVCRGPGRRGRKFRIADHTEGLCDDVPA